MFVQSTVWACSMYFVFMFNWPLESHLAFIPHYFRDEPAMSVYIQPVCIVRDFNTLNKTNLWTRTKIVIPGI